MKKENIVIIILSVLLVVTNIAWITYQFQSREVTQTKNWTWVKSWSGSESTKTTEAFRITGEEWLISWTFTGYAQGARCDIIVYNAYTDSGVKFLSLTDETRERYLNFTGRFYLKISVYGSIDNWYIDVNEYR